jgi:hypothetical protein
MQRDIHAGKMRGLSLGTDLVSDTNGDVLYRGQAELSVCEEGRRQGTWIDTINGTRVHQRANASMQSACLRRIRVHRYQLITHPNALEIEEAPLAQ